MLTCKRSAFTLPPRETYLNGAYMSPLLKKVEKAGLQGMKRKRNPFRVRPEDFFPETDQLREEFARLIGAKDPKKIVIVPSVSYGMGNVALNLGLQPGQHIVVAAEQFPSNYYPWKRVCDENGGKVVSVSPPEGTRARGKQWNERILEAINTSTRAVALPHVHWADGTLFDLVAIRKRAHEVGALLIVDGTQSVGALPFDLGEIPCDALVCAGYKWLLGPYGIGLAYYGEHFRDGKPLEENWINRKGSADFSKLVQYENEYEEGALRYEVGEHSNFILTPMLLAAVRQLNQWKPGNIQEYCRAISQAGIEQLREGGYWIEEEGYRGGHLFGIRLRPGMDMGEAKKRLQEKNIGVSFRGDVIRVSPHVYNTEEDMARLVRALLK